VIYFHWAGVTPSLPGNAMRYAKMGNGALGFDLNAHGILNGQPAEYYEKLASSTLNNYPFIGIENRDSCYFKGMYLRLLRTIEFLTRQPEWDGKRIVAIGESQGGGQAFAAAGLDKRVSLVVATAPAMCNWGGTLVGSKGSWPYPFESKFDRTIMLKTLPYYDAAHVLKGTNATIVAELGLIDQSCPSSNVFAALNQVKGKKIILNVPYRGHHMDQPAYKEIWDKTINKTKEEFLKDYLK
jgi:cephalosporin-C deacetylase-like acetyl esterase